MRPTVAYILLRSPFLIRELIDRFGREEPRYVLSRTHLFSQHDKQEITEDPVTIYQISFWEPRSFWNGEPEGNSR